MIVRNARRSHCVPQAQHDLIEDMFDQVLLASDPQAREQPFIELRHLLAVTRPPKRCWSIRGSPGIRCRGCDCRQLLKEEHDAKEQLSKIESLDITSQEFIDELTKLRDAVLTHAEHEEMEEFAKLQRNIDADELRRMGIAVKVAEAIAPTRPHAGVESAKLNFAVGPFASMLDRARDLMQPGSWLSSTVVLVP